MTGDIRTNAEIAGDRAFAEAFRHGVDGGRVFFRCAIRYWCKQVSEGAGGEIGALLASGDGELGSFQPVAKRAV
jgi:hypothetical protein